MAGDGPPPPPPKRMHLRVCVRLRPISPDDSPLVETENRLLRIRDPHRGHASEFVFDQLFPSSAGQEFVYQAVGAPLVEHVLGGYNACVFAYGQTGSGKTHSMFGGPGGEWGERGLTPRAAEGLLQGAARLDGRGQGRVQMYVSFLEIYLEHVRDLGRAAGALLPSGAWPGGGGRRSRPSSAREDRCEDLDILEDPSGLTFVKDLTHVQVKTVDDVMTVLNAGQALRQTASTAQNDVSSRSHTVFTLTVVQHPDADGPGGGQPFVGKLNLVDLAGSERLNKSHSAGVRLQEAKAINTSLTALGKVVMSLSHEGDHGHVAFRDSRLTRILKDSLNGNSYTTLLANLNPIAENYEECFNTLQFALRCSTIQTVPHINVLTAGTTQDKVIEQLTRKIEDLKEEIERMHAHYQKLIEQIAGPDYTRSLGLLEIGPPGEEQNEQDEGDAYRDAVALPPDLGNTKSRAASAAGTRPVSARDSEGTAATGVRSRRTSRAPRGGMSLQMVENQKAHLMHELERQKSYAKELEDQLRRHRSELDDMRERMFRSEQQQRADNRRLRESLQKAREQALEKGQEGEFNLEEQKRVLGEEINRLEASNEKLRGQLNHFTTYIDELTNDRNRDAAKFKESERRMKEGGEIRYKKMAEQVEKDRAREIESLTQRHSQLLTAKEREASELRTLLEDTTARSTEQVKTLKEEVEYLTLYARRMWHIFEGLCQGRYPVQAARGVRSLRIPAADRPENLDTPRMERLQASVARAGDFILAVEGRGLEQASATAGGDDTATSQAASRNNDSSTPATEEVATDSLPQSVHSSKWKAGAGESEARAAPEEIGDEPPDEEDLLPVVHALQQKIQELEQRGPTEDMRRQIGQEMKDVIEAQLLTEMTSQGTVDYIRSLEAQIARYRVEIQNERRRNFDLQTALRSAQRRTDSARSGPWRGRRDGPQGTAWATPRSRPASSPGKHTGRPATAGPAVLSSGALALRKDRIGSQPGCGFGSRGGQIRSQSGSGSDRAVDCLKFQMWERGGSGALSERSKGGGESSVPGSGVA
eukprot:evm.model.scf_946.1 EVM.evm.TU.scf_946.1   scf_946:6400-16587(+)